MKKERRKYERTRDMGPTVITKLEKATEFKNVAIREIVCKQKYISPHFIRCAWEGNGKQAVCKTFAFHVIGRYEKERLFSV